VEEARAQTGDVYLRITVVTPTLHSAVEQVAGVGLRQWKLDGAAKGHRAEQRTDWPAADTASGATNKCSVAKRHNARRMACSGGPKLKHADDSDEVAALNHLNAAERWGGVRGGAAGATRQGRMENTEGQSGFA
jgi:hypothetical protein